MTVFIVYLAFSLISAISFIKGCIDAETEDPWHSTVLGMLMYGVLWPYCVAKFIYLDGRYGLVTLHKLEDEAD